MTIVLRHMESDSESTYYYELPKELRASIHEDRTVDCTVVAWHPGLNPTRKPHEPRLWSRLSGRPKVPVGMLHDTHGSRPTSRSCRRPSLWIGRSNLVRKLDRQHPREQIAVTAKDHRQA